MAKSAGAITINLSAGTSQFVLDMEKANLSVKNFGQNAKQLGGSFSEMGAHGVTGVQAVSGALRVLEGGIANNLRAAERFTANVLGLGPILQAAFPVIGAIAFLGIVEKVGSEAQKLYTELRDAPEKLNGAWRQLSSGISLAGNEARVSIDRLDNEIAKLEGRRQNTLKLMLDEARVSADNLTSSLNKTFTEFSELLEKNKPGFWRQFFGEQSTFNLRQMVGGYTGTAGIQTRLDEASKAGEVKIAQAKTPKELAAAETERDINLQKILNDELETQNRLLAEFQRLSKPQPSTLYQPKPGSMEGAYYIPGKAAQDEKANIAQTQDYIQILKARQLAITQDGEIRTATRRKESDIAAHDNAMLERPFEDKLAALKIQVEAARAKLAAAGLDEADRLVADAHAKAIVDIEEVQKALGRLAGTAKAAPLPDAQKNQIEDLRLREARSAAEGAWQDKLRVTTKEITDQVQAQKMLTEAIGKGYEAVKNAAVQTEVMSRVTPEHFNDPAWMAAHQSDVSQIRNAAGAAYDASHAERAALATDKLGDQITLETRLAQVQSQGAEAVRLATLQVRLAKMEEDGATKEQIAAELELYRVTRGNDAAAEIANINQRIEAVKRLTAAQIDGADAVRKAELANSVAEIKRTTPEDHQQAAIDAATQSSQADHELKLSEAVSRRVNLYSQHLRDLQDEMEYLNGIQATEANRLDIVRVGRDLENERLHVLSEQALSMGGARDGIRAFFLEMQADGKKAAQTIYEALNAAVDGIAANFAKLMTGQKTAWKQLFQGIAEGIFADQVKSQIQKGIQDLAMHLPSLSGIGGALGQALGGKPDGTSPDKALWVRTIGANGVTGATNPSSSATPASGGTFGGGSQGGFIFSFLGAALGGRLPGRAMGGPVSPGQAYWVGEHGPERFTPSSAGVITSNSESQRLMGSGSNHFYTIDARGTDPVLTEQRVRTAIAAAHSSAIGTSVQVSQDRLRRVPQHA